MIEAIGKIDENLFLFLNGIHSPFFDTLMFLFSNMIFWGPLYVFFLWKLFQSFPKKYYIVLIFIVLLIASTDQLCNLSKETFMRFRPTHDPSIQGLVHTVNNYRGGMYGFFSGHAANSFAVVLFFLTALKWKPSFLIPIAFFYAIVTSYSRIYLGVHFPGDILIGSIIGSFLGFGFAKAMLKVNSSFNKDKLKAD